MADETKEKTEEKNGIMDTVTDALETVKEHPWTHVVAAGCGYTLGVRATASAARRVLAANEYKKVQEAIPFSSVPVIGAALVPAY